MRRGGSAVLGGLSAAALLGLGATGSATAATQVGENFSTFQSCGGDTWIQSTSPGQAYAAPFGGVLTSWIFGDSADSGLKLKVARPQGGNNFTIVGESESVGPVSAGPATFPTRIPVQAGDILGLYHASFADSCQAGLIPPPTYNAHRIVG